MLAMMSRRTRRREGAATLTSTLSDTPGALKQIRAGGVPTARLHAALERAPTLHQVGGILRDPRLEGRIRDFAFSRASEASQCTCEASFQGAQAIALLAFRGQIRVRVGKALDRGAFVKGHAMHLVRRSQATTAALCGRRNHVVEVVPRRALLVRATTVDRSREGLEKIEELLGLVRLIANALVRRIVERVVVEDRVEQFRLTPCLAHHAHERRRALSRLERVEGRIDFGNHVEEAGRSGAFATPRTIGIIHATEKVMTSLPGLLLRLLRQGALQRLVRELSHEVKEE